MEEKVKKQAKQIDTMEALVAELKSQVHRLINEKLVLINGTPRETTEHNNEEKPKGQTP